MPYDIFERDGEHCVYRVNDDGKPTGETLGCHAEYGDAEEQVQAFYANEPELTRKAAPNAVKFIGENSDRVGGYLVRFGGPDDRDLQGEYFTPATNLALDWETTRPALYHHGLDKSLKATLIGVIDTLKADGVGVWAEAQVAMSNEYWAAIAQLIQEGRIGWSSGTLPQMVEVTAEGEIKAWPIVEGSLTPTPAEPRNLVGNMKHASDAAILTAAYKSADLDLPDALKSDLAIESEAAEQGADEDGAALAQNDKPAAKTPPPEKGAIKMEPEVNIADVVAEQVAAALAKKEADEAQAELEAKAAHADELAAQVTALEAAAAERQEEQDMVPAKRLPGPGNGADTPQDGIRITVGSPYDDLDAVDMAWGVTVLKSARRLGNEPRVSERYAKALTAKAWQAGYRPLKQDGSAYKADELDYSTQASYGDEWVPDLWSAELWRSARQENVILPLFRPVEMPSNPYELPIESTDPTVYFVPETTDEAQLTIAGAGSVIPDSKIGSGKVQLTAKKLALRVGFSAELTEDSIVPVLALYREQALRAMADAIDNVLLNGDTTNADTGNINLDDANPPDTAKYLAFDGLRHLPIVTTTANAVDAAGAPTLALMRQARFTMAAKYSVNPNKLAWIVDAATYTKLLSLDEVVTVDKFGPQATVLTGEIGKLDGSPILVSAEMGLTEADGKISDTGGNNTKGQAVCVYTPGWIVGYRRRIAVAVDYLSFYDAYQMTATVRMAFNRFDADVAAALYNITV